MFHHFHNENNHEAGQGSINKDQLAKIIKYIGKKNILNPDEFILESTKRNKINRLKRIRTMLLLA